MILFWFSAKLHPDDVFRLYFYRILLSTQSISNCNLVVGNKWIEVFVWYSHVQIFNGWTMHTSIICCEQFWVFNHWMWWLIVAQHEFTIRDCRQLTRSITEIRAGRHGRNQYRSIIRVFFSESIYMIMLLMHASTHVKTSSDFKCNELCSTLQQMNLFTQQLKYLQFNIYE